MAGFKKIIQECRTRFMRSILTDSLFQFKAVTLTVGIGTFISIFIFVLFLRHDLRAQKKEFEWMGRSEHSFLQRELLDLQESLKDAHFRLKARQEIDLQDIEVLFRDEMRKRIFGIIFFLPLKKPQAKTTSEYHLLSGDSPLVSTEGLPNVNEFIDQEPQLVNISSSHPLYRYGFSLVALPFPGKGTLYLNIDLRKILSRVSPEHLSTPTTEIFLYSNERLLVSSEAENQAFYQTPIVRLKKGDLREFAAFYAESEQVFLNEIWTAILIPSEGHLSAGFTFYPWLFFGACILIMVLISLAFYQLVSRQAEIEETVQLRTKELQEKSEELERVNKELNDFAYIVSHDLQEPIRTISTFLDVFFAEHSASVSPEGTHLLERIKAASKRMHRLLKDILKYSRLSVQTQDFQSVDTQMLIQEVWDDLQAKVDETKAVLIIEDELPNIHGDPPQVQQLFQNLLSNALKFRKPDVSPIVRVSSRFLEEEQVWEFQIQDNGIGFDPKYAEMIFKPFHRLHREEEVEGSGIGLAICRKIVERHRGSIKVQSEKGRGSTFILRLRPEKFFQWPKKNAA